LVADSVWDAVLTPLQIRHQRSQVVGDTRLVLALNDDLQLEAVVAVVALGEDVALVEPDVLQADSQGGVPRD